MKKIILLICLVLFLFAGSMAQKADLNSDFPRNDVRISYGMTTVNQIALTMLVATSSIFIIPLDTALRISVNGYGAFAFQYQYRLSKLIQLGALVTYNPGSFEIRYDKGTTSYTSSMFLSFMPRVDFTYIRKPLFTLYSGIALGATYMLFRNNYTNQPDDVSSGVSFGFQLNGIGIRVGKDIGGFLEIGFGSQGLFNFGVSARL